MITRMIVPALLSAVMFTTPVLAAGSYGAMTPATQHTQKAAAMTPAEKCTNLEKQFDSAIKKHEKAAKAGEAKTLRTEGGNLCASGKHAEGVAKLEQALKDIGVKSKS